MGVPKPVQCNGEEFASIKLLSERYGFTKEKVTRRLAFGWTPEQAVDIEPPPRRLGSTGKPLIFDGVRYTSLVEASLAKGVNPKLVASRVATGYSAEDAIRGNLKGPSRPRGKPIEFRGTVYPSRENLCSRYGLLWSNVQQRLKAGWTMEQALNIDPPPPRFRDFEGHARDHKWKEVRVADGKTEPIPDAGGYKLYLVTNVTNGKTYVGITVASLQQRLKQHFAAARKGRMSAFTNALRKYGELAFKIELIHSNARTYDELQELEVSEIVKRDTIHNGYNTARGGSIGTSKTVVVAGRIFQSYATAAEAHGVDSVVFSIRLGRLKWTPDEAAGLIPKQWAGKAVEVVVEGKTFKSIRAAAAAYGVVGGTAWSRLRLKGWTIAQALGLAPPPASRSRPA